MYKRQGVDNVTRNTGKGSENVINVATENKVSNNDNYSNELTSSGDKIVENGVCKSDIVCNSDDDERVNLLEVINGVVISIDGLEKEWKEHLQVKGLKRVNFSCGVVGGEERSSRMYWVDKCSTNNCPLSFNEVPGRARKCFYDLVPSAWDGRESRCV